MAAGGERKGLSVSFSMRRAAIGLFVAALTVSVSACSPATMQRATESMTKANDTNSSTEAPHRFVSFAPSNTELIYAIGAQDELKGVSSFCDYPPQVKEKEQVGTFVSANFERLARLQAQSALLVSGQDGLASQLKQHNVRVDVMRNFKVSDIAQNVRRLGELTNHKDAAETLASNLEARLKELHAIIAKAESKQRVFYCVWPQPLMTAGKKSFLNDVVTECGGVNVAGDIDAEYPQFSAERLVNANPDSIVLPYETAKQKDFLNRAPWNTLRAVQDNRVYVLPDTQHDHLSRPTLRIVLGISWLAKQLHPDLKDELSKWEERSRSSLKLARDE